MPKRLKETMIRSDFHMHTAFSTDSEEAVESMLNRAVERGSIRFASQIIWMRITRRIDELGESAFRLDTENYFPFLLKKKKEYEERIQVRIGIELGLQKHLGTRYETLIEKYPFDFVIGSMHLVCGEDPYTGKVFEELGDAQVYRRMFCETLECIRKIKCFDVLGHLDYVVRYGKHQAEAYSYESFLMRLT